MATASAPQVLKGQGAGPGGVGWGGVGWGGVGVM
jgi:hypothetical protein